MKSGHEDYEFRYGVQPINIVRNIAAHSFIIEDLNINVELCGKSVLDIGGGLCSLLLSCFNYSHAVIVDPTNYPEKVSGLSELYNKSGIEFVNICCEDMNYIEQFDEVWIYNVLPHVHDVNTCLKKIYNAVKYDGIIRIMEPHNEPYEGHPQKINENTLEYLDSICDIIKDETVNYSGIKQFYNKHYIKIYKKKIMINLPKPSNIQKDKIKIHIYGMPHTITVRDDPRFMTCAYTTKVFLLAKKFFDEGHEVVHYGVEGSNVPCTENVEYIPRKLWEKCHGNRDVGSFHEHSTDSETYQFAGKNLPTEINKRITDPTNEVVLASFGYWNKNLKNINSAALIEYGIGYTGTFSKYRVYESYSWQHVNLGRTNYITGQKWDDAVIPGYVEPGEFEYSDKKDNYILFVGRIIDTKGIFIAHQLAQKLGIKLVVAGNGDTSWISSDMAKHIEYVGVIGIEEKRELYKNAMATICLSQYSEPFGNVHVESMISGTPVITTDWGVYTETVPHGIVGYRGRKWEDHLYALRNIDKINPKDCRDWAMANFTLDSVYDKFNVYFKRCARNFCCPNGQNPWYLESSNYEDYFVNYYKNFEEYKRNREIIPPKQT